MIYSLLCCLDHWSAIALDKTWSPLLLCTFHHRRFCSFPNITDRWLISGIYIGLLSRGLFAQTQNRKIQVCHHFVVCMLQRKIHELCSFSDYEYLTLKYIPIWNVLRLIHLPISPRYGAVQYNNADSILRRFAILMSCCCCCCCCCSVFRFKNAIVAWMDGGDQQRPTPELKNEIQEIRLPKPSVGPCEYVKGEVQRNASFNVLLATGPTGSGTIC